jgi:hypothetical protein
MAEEDPASLAKRIDEIESRAAIADLIHIYGPYIRQDQPDRVAELFTPDGVFENRNGEPDRPEHAVAKRLVGRDELNAFYAPMKGSRQHPIPMVHNIVVVVDGDTATATCVMEGQIYGTTHRFLGDYRDSFRRIDGRWYFSERIYTMYSGKPDG